MLCDDSESMGTQRGHKFIKSVAHRGWKFAGQVAKRGHKFLKDTVKSVGDADTLARKGANTINTVGDYAHLAGSLLGNERISQVGTGLHDLGQSIHNIRRGALANRIRHDFGGAAGTLPSRSIMKEKLA